MLKYKFDIDVNSLPGEIKMINGINEIANFVYSKVQFIDPKLNTANVIRRLLTRHETSLNKLFNEKNYFYHATCEDMANLILQLAKDKGFDGKVRRAGHHFYVDFGQNGIVDTLRKVKFFEGKNEQVEFYTRLMKKRETVLFAFIVYCGLKFSTLHGFKVKNI